MGVKKREDGTYVVSYSKRHPKTRVPQSARRYCTDKGDVIRTEVEAKRIYSQLVEQVVMALHDKIVPTWYQVVQEYGEAAIADGISQKTVDNALTCLAAHTFPKWGTKKVTMILGDDIRKILVDAVGSRSTSHQKNMLKFIRAVMRLAVSKGYLPTDPTPVMKFKIGDKIKAVLNEIQIGVLLNRAKELESSWYYHWALALYTGMRNGELYALTWDKVDLDNRRIKVDRSWNQFDGFKSTKSGDDRMVEIAPTLLPVLKELKLKHGNSTFVLPRIDSWDKGQQAKCLRMFLIGLGIPPVRFHDLRASWATVMLGKGIEPAKVMIMGGWKDLKTMMIYMRKAGIAIKGITDDLDLHNPSRDAGEVVDFFDCRKG